MAGKFFVEFVDGEEKRIQNSKKKKNGGHRAVLTLCGMPQINGYGETLE